MNARKVGQSKWQMLEMPDGISTSNGIWYHITRERIENYVPGLLKKVRLERIIQQADAWVVSVDGLALLLYFVLLFLWMPPLTAFIISILFYLFVYLNTAALTSVWASRLMQVFANDGFLYGISALLLIGISFNSTGMIPFVPSQMTGVWYGVGLVFLFKVGLLRLLMKFIESRKQKGVERHDRILNMLLIRYGMSEGILTKSVDEMQDELIRLQNYHKTRKKK
ncbi:MAG: hypothetical protein JJ895_01715 [Balneolaceae bacterium]|nr:hypothetical protein [Balneolaceae bacterium]